MRRTISSLMVLGIISGCSGGESDSGGTAPAGDRQAPSVAISAPASVEGGETVPLTVTVTDNVDTGLTPTISCNGGTLTGTMLVTAPVLTNTTIQCTATATDRAGNVGTGNITITVRATTASLTVAPGASTTLSQSKFGVLDAKNLPLTQATYSGTLGGRPVTLVRTADGSSLTFATPTGVSAGAQTLTVVIGTRTYNFNFQVEAPVTVADPRGVVLAYLTNSRDGAQAFLAANNATLNATAKADITAKIAQLQAGIAAIGGFSADDLLSAAIYIQVNGLNGGGFTALSQRAKGADATLCNRYTESFLFSVITTISAAELTALGLPFAGTPVGALIVAGGTLLTYLVFDKGVLKSLDGIFDACFDFGLPQLSTFNLPQNARAGQSIKYVKPIATAGRLGFANDKATAFKLSQRRSLFASVAGSIQSSAQKLYALGVKYNYVPDSLASLVQKAGGFDEAIPAASVALGGITGNISGSLSPAGTDIISLRFKAINPTTENIDFSFVLTPAEGSPLPVDATLTVELPKVNDAALAVTQGQVTGSSVQVSGADTLEVVTAPAHGSVVLQNSGSFVYTPAGQYFGTDSFTYRGRNTNGVSQPATVLITVSRRFEGAWQITSRSTTTSQSSPGLCPNETNNFSINVSKISDTQYTTSYQGFPITLIMSSVNDPAGPSGSTTVTYPDDPGTTTETVNAQIPDSSHITGSGSFSYSGPQNTRCSGTTSITGVR